MYVFEDVLETQTAGTNCDKPTSSPHNLSTEYSNIVSILTKTRNKDTNRRINAYFVIGDNFEVVGNFDDRILVKSIDFWNGNMLTQAIGYVLDQYEKADMRIIDCREDC